MSVEVAQRRYVLREVERNGTQPRACEDETYPQQKEKAGEGRAESVRSYALQAHIDHGIDVNAEKTSLKDPKVTPYAWHLIEACQQSHPCVALCQ